jgi:hypothetical protein
MGQERRRFARVTQPFNARYRRYGELSQSWRTIKTLNISASGLRFCDAEMLEPLGILELELTLPSLREPLMLRGQVVWNQTLASGVNEYGVEFVEVSPQQGEQIDLLVKFLLK